jgi:uncharacterized protein (UPF0248 family)
MLLRDLLNRIIWDPREAHEDYEILFIHRGVNGNVKRISMSDIVKVSKSWFIYLDSGSEQPIPLHRVLKVVNHKTREVLWSKS